MKKIIIWALYMVLVMPLSMAQAPPISWNLTNVNSNILNSIESAAGITAIPNVGYMMTGHTRGYYDDIVNVLISPNGNILNTFKFGENYSDISSKIKTVSDGNVINIYSLDNYCHPRNSPASSLNFYDMRIRKSNPTTGVQSWINCYGGTGIDAGYDITELNDGSFIAVGSSSPGQNGTADGDITSIYGGYDIWIIKISSTGALQWSKSYGTAAQDAAYGVAKSSDGNVIVSGIKGQSAWGAKINIVDGSIIWDFTVLTGTGYRSIFSAVETDASGNIIFCGTSNATTGDFAGNHGGDDLWVYKTDGSGTKIWSKVFGGPGTESGAALVIENDNSIVVTGATNQAGGDVSKIWGGSDQWTIKIATSGSLLWEKNMGSAGSDGGVGIVKALDGVGYVTAASTNALYTSGDIYCPKGYLWAARLGGIQQGIPSNPVVWFKADAGVTGSGTVTGWADQSGNNYNASVVSGANGPALVANAINGKPALRFNGNAGLSTTTILNQACKNKMHLFAVIKKNSSNSQQTIFDSKAGSYNTGILLQSNLGATTCNNCQNDEGLAAIFHEYGYPKSVNATDVNHSDFQAKKNCYMLVEVVFDGSLTGDEMQLYIDGNRIIRNPPGTDNGNSSSNFIDASFIIGCEKPSTSATNFFNGEIAELIVYPYIMQDRNSSAFQYLRTKYFPGTLNNFSAVVTASQTSDQFSNNSMWKFPYFSGQPNNAMLAVADPCNNINVMQATTYIDANPIYTAPNGSKFLKRHFKVTNAQTGDRKLRLYFTQQEFDDYKTALGGTFTINDLQVVKYKGPSEDDVYNPDDATELLTLNATVGDEFNNKYLEVTVNSFSEFWIRVNPAALSVSFGDINAYVNGNTLFVDWKTLDEKESDKFDIEVSRDGKNFKTIGSVKSLSEKGFSSTDLTYSYQSNLSDLTSLFISIFALLCLTPLKNRKKKTIGMLLLVFFSLSFWTCRKKETLFDDATSGIYVRIVQIDKNNVKHYSKVIKAIQK